MVVLITNIFILQDPETETAENENAGATPMPTGTPQLDISTDSDDLADAATFHFRHTPRNQDDGTEFMIEVRFLYVCRVSI